MCNVQTTLHMRTLKQPTEFLKAVKLAVLQLLCCIFTYTTQSLVIKLTEAPGMAWKYHVFTDSMDQNLISKNSEKYFKH